MVEIGVGDLHAVDMKRRDDTRASIRSVDGIAAMNNDTRIRCLGWLVCIEVMAPWDGEVCHCYRT